MNTTFPHLFVDISSHGFGHLAQAAPILNELSRRLPGLRLTVRTGLPPAKLHARLLADFTHIPATSDFGYVMRDATRIDLGASAAAYRDQHANWAQRVDAESAFLSELRPDLVLTDVAYLPLAGAAKAGIPSLSMSSLNWADIFAYLYGSEPWAKPIHRQMLAAYNGAEGFLRLTPAMPMGDLHRVISIAPVAALGVDRRNELREKLNCRPGEKLVLIAYGGVEKQLPVEAWPVMPGLRWLVSQDVPRVRADMADVLSCGMAFSDLLRSVDAILTKPGYGTFVEAACGGVPVLYQRRDDWPEQDVLIDWLKTNARCAEIDQEALMTGQLVEALHELWRQPLSLTPRPDGVSEAAEYLYARLKRDS